MAACVLAAVLAGPTFCAAPAAGEFNLLPAPQAIRGAGPEFRSGPRIDIVAGDSAEDRFTAEDLAGRLRSDFSIQASAGAASTGGRAITLVRGGAPETLGQQGYQLRVEPGRITLRANGAPGLFYATRTLLQLMYPCEAGACAPGVSVEDWPEIPQRAVHYDTKHHQDRAEYVRSFIRTLADYKINMLVWEWEDKFAYESHPEIGAPGAFTKKEMQEFTRYARRYHIQIVPLVQGLGHASYILKWPQHSRLREIAASNWEFCPRKDGAYKLLGDLWREAAEATPGSEYLHIGSDETFELGAGVECGCKARAQEAGKYGLMQDFVGRAAELVGALGRKTMSWGGEFRPNEKIRPPAGLVATDIEDVAKAQAVKRAGYPAWVYDPNPGIEHLFLPYVYRLRDTKEVSPSLVRSREVLTAAAADGGFDGMICTSWDDSGLHNEAWMMRFVHAGTYSWNGKAPAGGEFNDRYFAVHYGPAARDLPELWDLLNRGAYFYMDSFGRKVWHWGNITRTRLPDLPRGDAIEYIPFWNRENRDMVERSRAELKRMLRAQEICRANQAAGARRTYDFEVFDRVAALIAHTARTYVALAALEDEIGRAHKLHFVDNAASAAALDAALKILNDNLEERENVFAGLTATWLKTSLPKGLSLPEKKFFHQQDRARHFAFRRPDMTYLICDEQALGVEEYAAKLRDYSEWYKRSYLRKGAK